MKLNRTPTLLAALFIIIPAVTTAQSHGSNCGPTSHCLVNAGLICHESKCACGNGTLTEAFRYSMTWDNATSQCVGLLDSVCVGTGRFPPPSGTKAVRCADPLTCVQIPGQALGLGVCRDIPTTSGFGAVCNQNLYCDPNAGLICDVDEKRCVCGGGAVTNSVSYDLEWDVGRGVCVGVPGSGCVVAGEGVEKAVDCWRGACVQLAGMPPGVGICERSVEDNSSTTTEDGGEGGGETTPTAGGDGLIGKVNYALVIAVLSLSRFM